MVNTILHVVEGRVADSTLIVGSAGVPPQMQAEGRFCGELLAAERTFLHPARLCGTIVHAAHMGNHLHGRVELLVAEPTGATDTIVILLEVFL